VRVIESAEEGKLDVQASLSESLGTLMMALHAIQSRVLIASRNENPLVRGLLRPVVITDHHLRPRHDNHIHAVLVHDWLH
jgi:hypothetical protein